MPDSIAYDASSDPLYRDPPLRHRAVLPVLGVPVHYRTNAAAVLATIEDAFGGWRVLERSPRLLAAEPVRVTIIVQPGDEGGPGRAALYSRVLGGHRVLYASRGSVGIADPDRREGIAYVTAQYAADRQHFRYTLVEAITLGVVTPLDRQPFHAAALVRGGAALLIAGPSGVGKSTLAYAAIRSGLQVLAEDMVFLQARPRLRIWGLPGYLHLPRDAARRFPELAELTPTLLANGKTKLAVDLRARGAVPELPVIERAALCLLTRTGDAPGLHPLPAPELERRLTERLESGFDLFADTIREPIRLLTARGGWRLELPADPADAVPWLQAMFDEVDASAA